MPRLALLLSIVLGALSAACNADQLASDLDPVGTSDAGVDSGQVSGPRVDAGTSSLDAVVLHDTGLVEDDVGASQDAGPAVADGGAVLRDAAATVCSADAALAVDAGSCAGQLCSASGGDWLTLHGAEPWYVGGLDWVLAVCDWSLGWLRARSSDGRDIGYRVSSQDVAELKAGAPLQVYWGAPGSDPALARRCTFEAREPLPACPFEGTCTAEHQARIAALPPRPECLPCSGDAGIDPCFGAGSCACWCSLREGLRDACPGLLP